MSGVKLTQELLDVWKTWGSHDITWDSTDLAWGDFPPRAISVEADESLFVTESNYKKVTKASAEILKMDDLITKSLALSISELMSLAEIYHDDISFNLMISEALVVSDKLTKETAVSKSEAFELLDEVTKSFLLSQVRDLRLTESWDREVGYRRAWLSELRLEELTSREISMPHQSSLSIADQSPTKSIELGISESLVLAELWVRQVAFRKSLSEGLSVSEAIEKSYDMKVSEKFDIYDEYIRNSNAVISDLVFFDHELSEAEFARLVDESAPVGFGDFRAFVAGDYDYQEAMFKFAMASTNTDRAQINNLNIEVDLPDVFDRGSASVPASAFRVDFNRVFSNIPEISVVVKGGTVMTTPDIVANDSKGFEVRLLAADNSLLPGIISWKAHGY